MAVVLTSDQENRLAFKRGLLNKVEHALTPPTPEPDPEPATVEILHHYADVPFTVSRTDTRLFRSLDPSSAPPAVEEDWSFVLDSDAPKRAAFKQNLLHKVAETLVPSTEPQSEAVEIIDSYSPWRVIEPIETIDPGVQDEKDFILDRDVPKRAAFKDSLLSKVADALTPAPPEPEPRPVEIIEKYRRGTQRPSSPVETIDPGFEVNRPTLVPDGVLHSDIPQRDAFRDGLLHKVDEALAPPAPAPAEESAPIEIIEKYLGPQRLDPDEMAPEYKRVEPFILDSDTPKREAIREALLGKASMLPVVPARVDTPVEIIGYSQRAPSPLGIEYPEVVSRASGSKSLETENAAPPDQVDTTVPLVEEVPVLLLPGNYRELDEHALYGVLIRTPYLKHSSDTANLVLDILAGRIAQTVDFMVVDEPSHGHGDSEKAEAHSRLDIPDQFKVQDHEKRVAVAAQLAKKIRDVSVQAPVEVVPEPAYLDFDIPEDWRDVSPTVLRGELLSQGATPEQADTVLSQWLKIETAPLDRVVMVAELAVELPRDFASLTVADKYAYLTKHALLAPEDANDAIAAFDSKPQHGSKTFTFSFADIIDPDKRQERKEYLSSKTEAALHVTPGTGDPEDLLFLLPTNYTDLSEVELHYLMAHTPELGYSHETVYQSLDILFGRVPQPPHIRFKTVELDNPILIGRKDEPVSVIKIETTEKPKASSILEG